MKKLDHGPSLPSLRGDCRRPAQLLGGKESLTNTDSVGTLLDPGGSCPSLGGRRCLQWQRALNSLVGFIFESPPPGGADKARRGGALCDGVPRLSDSGPTTEVTYTTVITPSPSTPCYLFGHTTHQEECARLPTAAGSVAAWDYQLEAPRCRISPSNCVGVSRSWESVRSDPTASVSGWWHSPRCDIYTLNSDQCTITGNSIQLIYFPVPTTVSRDMCASTTALAPAPSKCKGTFC